MKREIGRDDIELIEELIERYAHLGRTYISKKLCQIWDWRTTNGGYRDIACRDLLRRLDSRGLIQLPPPLGAARRAGYTNKVKKLNDYPEAPIIQCLSDFSNWEFLMVRGKPEESLYNQLVDSFHYLGYHQGSGEQLKYLIKADGHILACIGFGGAAYKVSERDNYIGWDRAQRERHLSLIANNNRFLILPFVRVKNLASFILGHIARRIAADWRAYYHHDIVLLESFVERDRFRGSCYKAANWKYLGHTTGRGRNDRYSRNRVPIKDIYVYPLIKNFRERLIGCTD